MIITDEQLEYAKQELKEYIRSEIKQVDSKVNIVNTKADNALYKSTEALEIASELDSENAVNKTVRSFTGRY